MGVWDHLVKFEETKEGALDSVLDMKFGATCVNSPIVSLLYTYSDAVAVAAMLLHLAAATSFFL